MGSEALQILADGIVAGAAYYLFASAFPLVRQAHRCLNVSHGAIYTAGAYLTYACCVELHLSCIGALALSGSAAVVVGAIVDHLGFRPPRRVASHATAPLLASPGVYAVLTSIVATCYGDQVQLLAGERWSRVGLTIVGCSVTVGEGQNSSSE